MAMKTESVEKMSIISVLTFSIILSTMAFSFTVSPANAEVDNRQGCSASNDQPGRCTNGGYPEADCQAFNHIKEPSSPSALEGALGSTCHRNQ